MRWLADEVAKALFNVIDMPCDTKACTWHSEIEARPSGILPEGFFLT